MVKFISHTKRYIAVAMLFILSACVETVFYSVDWAKDVAASEAWMTLAMQGDVEAQYKVGSVHCCGDRPRYDNVRALYWFCKAGKQNQRDALFEIGEIYRDAHEYQGSTIPRNNVMAATYFQLAAERGNDDAVQPYRDLSVSISEAEKAKVDELVAAWPDIPCEVYR